MTQKKQARYWLLIKFECSKGLGREEEIFLS